MYLYKNKRNYMGNYKITKKDKCLIFGFITIMSVIVCYDIYALTSIFCSINSLKN